MQPVFKKQVFAGRGKGYRLDVFEAGFRGASRQAKTYICKVK